MNLQLSILAAGMLALAGCSEPTGPKTVKSRDLTVKVPAIKEAVDSKDMTAAPQLVEDLDSDDAALRLYAIQGLHRLTGEDFGYRYYADPETRRPAIVKWRQWLAEHGPK